MANVIQIEPTCCARCDTILDAIEPIDGTPVQISITICDCCGHLMMVEQDLTLREPTTQEFRELTSHPAVAAERQRAIN
jgi:hypothetical protein